MKNVLLYPFGLLYMLVTLMNRKLFESGIRRKKRLPRPVVSVGNLTMGGSGKTPLTKFLAKKLIGKGVKPAIVLRGYGRKTKGPFLVTAGSTAEEVGEEALLYKRELEIDVAVAEKREEALAVLPSRRISSFSTTVSSISGYTGTGTYSSSTPPGLKN